MRKAVQGIAVVLYVVPQLTPEKGVHAAYSSGSANRNIFGTLVAAIASFRVIP
jgi:hypothetical protein